MMVRSITRVWWVAPAAASIALLVTAVAFAAAPKKGAQYVSKKPFIRLVVDKSGKKVTAEICGGAYTTPFLKLSSKGAFSYKSSHASTGLGVISVSVKGKFVSAKKASGTESGSGGCASQGGKFTATLVAG